MMRIRLQIDDVTAATIRQRAGQKRVALQDYVRYLLERAVFSDMSAQEIEHIAENTRFTSNLLVGLVRRVTKADPSEADRLIYEARTHTEGGQ